MALFLIGTVLLLVLLSYLYQAVQTLYALDRIESERDHWQRPTDVVQALNLSEGGVVVDFGSGVGYFALKLPLIVGKSGSIVAEDIRQEPLVFLRIRALLRGRHNLRTIRGETDNPRLPAGFADAVLIANTYHELTEPKQILRHLAESLKRGGRLVIVDRALRSGPAELVNRRPNITNYARTWSKRRFATQVLKSSVETISSLTAQWMTTFGGCLSPANHDKPLSSTPGRLYLGFGSIQCCLSLASDLAFCN